MKVSWDIFCTVVDNYGDIGVTWRLARQLVAEHHCAVRLWVDDLRAFERLCPSIDPQADRQWQQGVEVCHWPSDWVPTDSADVVIAAFACQLPTAYLDAMAARESAPLWLNLDYLSAEDWIVGCHGLPSLKYQNVQKYFFFPGFQPGTGGLLREAGLLEQRRRFQQNPPARLAFLEALGVKPAPQARLISLFAYENTGLGDWLDVMAAGSTLSHVLIPEGRVLADVQRWLGVESLATGDCHVRGNLTLQVLPFVPQEDYDRLLWSCDFNAVRGEDSFIRAQWAGRPLLWHIYQQEAEIHLDKLEAFLALYTQALSAPAKAALVAFWQGWNAGQGVGGQWLDLQEHWLELTEHAERWCLEQASQADLAAALVQFYRNWL